MSKLSRRSIVASAAALPALTLPALADATSDPIFAAIEKHKRVHVNTLAAMYRESEVWNVPGRAQEHASACKTLDGAFVLADAAALDLVNIEPTTIAGVIALLSYYVEAEVTDFQIFPDDDLGDESGTVAVGGDLTFGHFLARNVARALSKCTGTATAA